MINRRGWLAVALWAAVFVGFALTVSHVHVQQVASTTVLISGR